MKTQLCIKSEEYTTQRVTRAAVCTGNVTKDCTATKKQVGSEQRPFREDTILKEEMNANSSTNFLCVPFTSLIRWQFQAFTPVIEKHYANLAQLYTSLPHPKNNMKYLYKEHTLPAFSLTNLVTKA